jgi:hypothetical protein
VAGRKQLADFMRAYWAAVPDRAAATEAARASFEGRFLREAEGDPALAEQLRRAYYRELAILGVTARRRKAIQRAEQASRAAAINAGKAAKAKAEIEAAWDD